MLKFSGQRKAQPFDDPLERLVMPIPAQIAEK